MAGVSSKNAKVRVGASVILATEWEAVPKSRLPETTTFEDGGFERRVADTRGAKVTVKGVWDPAFNPFAAPPDLVDGAEINNLYLFTNGIPSPQFTFPVFIVEEAPVRAKIGEAIYFEFSGYSQGPYTYPGGFN